MPCLIYIAGAKFEQHPSNIFGRQCAPVVRALSLRSGDPGLKTRSNHSLSPWFNFPAALVNSQLVCLRPVGILNSCCCCSVPLFRCVSLALKSPYGEGSMKYVLYIEDITRWREDMNFIFEWQEQY